MTGSALAVGAAAAVFGWQSGAVNVAAFTGPSLGALVLLGAEWIAWRMGQP